MQAEAYGVFAYFYEAANIARSVQDGRADPDNVRRLIADATDMAKITFPHLSDGFDGAAHQLEGAVKQGLELKSTHPA